MEFPEATPTESRAFVGALEICISPSKGVYIARIKKIAP
jgi:hypothetical protein